MKKIFSASLILCLLLAMSIVTAYAAPPSILVDFGDDPTAIENLGVNGAATNVEYEAKDFYATFTATGSDPNVSMDYSADDVSKVLWAKIRVSNPGPATAVELFGATDGRGLTGSECTHFAIQPNTPEWKTYTISVAVENVKTVNAYKAAEHAVTDFYWAGSVDWIRLDPMWQEGDDGQDAGGNMAEGDQIMIDYVAFFATEADANAYMSANETATAAAAAPVETAAPEAPAPEAPAAEAAPAPAPEAPVTAPQTSDILVVAGLALLVSGLSAVVLKKKSK